MMTYLIRAAVLIFCFSAGCGGAQREPPRLGPTHAETEPTPPAPSAASQPLATHVPTAQTTTAQTTTAQTTTAQTSTAQTPAEDNPFSGGADSLAVEEEEETSSVRAKLALNKLRPNELLVRVVSADDRTFPRCVITARVTRPARSRVRQHRMIGRGKTYRFKPPAALQLLDPASPVARPMIGLCYYPAGTPLVLEVVGVDRAGRAFELAGVRGAW